MTEVDVVRVFTDERGEFGNELGILLSTEETRGAEQRIAAELGFSETVFVDGIDDREARIRIFTPTTELPFAGHPSVGTAWWLARRGTPVTTLAEPAGDVAVHDDGDLTWVSADPDWTPDFRWQPLDHPDLVDALDPDDTDSGQVYCWAWQDEAAGRLRSRMFAPALGIREDEATGAAAVRLTPLLGRDLVITQGRGSQLMTAIESERRVRVGGRVVADRSVTLRPR